MMFLRHIFLIQNIKGKEKTMVSFRIEIGIRFDLYKCGILAVILYGNNSVKITSEVKSRPLMGFASANCHEP